MKLSEILSIKERGYAVPEGADYHILVTMLESNLGDSEQDIRDSSFEILSAWSTRGILTDTELLNLGDRMAANLFIGLGEVETDSVFLRAFSALVLSDVIESDQIFSEGKCDGRSTFLSPTHLRKWLNQALEFFIREQDFRGYIPIKRWAHSIAHCGDLLVSISSNSHSKKDEHLQILETIAKKLAQPATQIFSGFDDARLCRIVATIWARNLLSKDDYERWLEQIVSPFTEVIWWEEKPDPSSFPNRLKARLNTRMFLNTLYFMLLFGERRLCNIDSNRRSFQEHRESLLDMISHVIRNLDNNDFYFDGREN